MSVAVSPERLAELSLGDAEFLARLTSCYLADARNQTKSLRSAVAGRDWAEALERAHRLRGSSLNIGADRLGAVLGDLERSVRGDEPEIARIAALLADAEVDPRRYDEAETIKGKVAYMSPEQCQSQPLDHRSDDGARRRRRALHALPARPPRRRGHHRRHG